MADKEIRAFPLQPGYRATIPDGWSFLQAVEFRGECLVLCVQDPPAPVPAFPDAVPPPIDFPVAPTPEPEASEEGEFHA